MALNRLKNLSSKGMTFNLDKEGDHLRHLRVILKWDGSSYEGKQFDADLTVAMLEYLGERPDGSRRLNIYGEDEANLVFYGSENRYFVDTNPRSLIKMVTGPNGKEVPEDTLEQNKNRPINICSAHDEIIHTGDNRNGEGEGEVAEIFLDRMGEDVAEIAIVGTIHKGKQRRQNWGDLNATLVLQNIDTGENLAEISLGRTLSNDTAVQFASLYRDESGDWQFTRMDSGSDVGLDFFIEHWVS